MMLNRILEFTRLEHERLKSSWDLEWHSDRHVQMIILTKFETLCRAWRAGQKLPGEADDACRTRLDAKQRVIDKRARENVRRIHVSSLLSLFISLIHYCV
jgi:hypothetical protein